MRLILTTIAIFTLMLLSMLSVNAQVTLEIEDGEYVLVSTNVTSDAPSSQLLTESFISSSSDVESAIRTGFTEYRAEYNDLYQTGVDFISTGDLLPFGNHLDIFTTDDAIAIIENNGAFVTYGSGTNTSTLSGSFTYEGITAVVDSNLPFAEIDRTTFDVNFDNQSINISSAYGTGLQANGNIDLTTGSFNFTGNYDSGLFLSGAATGSGQFHGENSNSLVGSLDVTGNSPEQKGAGIIIGRK